MKKLLLGLGLIVFVAGCASSDNGMGGSSDQSYQDNSTSSAQFNNNATHGTGTSTATNSGTGM